MKSNLLNLIKIFFNDLFYSLETSMKIYAAFPRKEGIRQIIYIFLLCKQIQKKTKMYV